MHRKCIWDNPLNTTSLFTCANEICALKCTKIHNTKVTPKTGDGVVLGA